MAEGVLLVLGLVLWRALRRRGLRAPVLEHLPGTRAFGLGVLYVYAVQLRWGLGFAAVQLLLAWQPAPPPIEAWLGMAVGPAEHVWLALLIAAAAPAAEEVLFRGVLLPSLAEHMRPYSALTLSSGLFALLHVPTHGVHALAIAGIGAALGWVRLHTRSLSTCVMLHSFINASVLVLRWLR